MSIGRRSFSVWRNQDTDLKTGVNFSPTLSGKTRAFVTWGGGAVETLSCFPSPPLHKKYCPPRIKKKKVLTSPKKQKKKLIAWGRPPPTSLCIYTANTSSWICFSALITQWTSIFPPRTLLNTTRPVSYQFLYSTADGIDMYMMEMLTNVCLKNDTQQFCLW